MKIQYASDLHLELTHNAKYINTLPIEVVGDVLVLAGDIFNLCDKNPRHTPNCTPFFCCFSIFILTLSRYAHI